MESQLALCQLLFPAKALDLIVQPEQAPFPPLHAPRLPRWPQDVGASRVENHPVGGAWADQLP
jgi:hypothetical protein